MYKVKNKIFHLTQLQTISLFLSFASHPYSPSPMNNINSSGHVSPLAINTLSSMHIKSEPITPPRDTTTPSTQLRPLSNNTDHLSPGHLAASPGMPGHLSPSGMPSNMSPHLSPSTVGQAIPGHVSPSMSGHLSPMPLNNSRSSPVNSHHLDYDSPMVKRSRMEGWTT